MNTKNWAKWYVILWRCIWIVPVYLSLFLLVALKFCAYGPKNAVTTWKDNT
jgi:hypothetical protein